MNKRLKSALAGTVFSLVSLAPVYAETYNLSLDLSGSNPITTSQDFADVVGARVAREISKLKMGDFVSVRTFGQMGLSNIRKFEVQINRRNRPSKVARQVAGLISSIPKGNLAAQSATNIIAEFELNNYQCNKGDRITFVTDGIEASSYIPNPQKLLDGAAQLPTPQSGLLQNCHVVFLGIGQNLEGTWSPQSIQNLRRAWQTYFMAAGATFQAVTNP